MNLVYLIVLCAGALLIQSSIIPVILPHWLAAGCNLALMVTAYVSISRGKLQGMLTGLVLGYFQDALAGSVIGLSGTAYILAGFVGGVLSRRLFVGSIGPRFWCLLATTAVALLSRSLLVEMFGLPSINVFSGLFLWALAGNTMFALLLYQILFKLEVTIGVRSVEEISLGS